MNKTIMFLSTYSSFSVIFVAQQTRNRFQRRLQRHEGDLERLCHNKRKNVKDSSTEAAHLLWTADLFLPVCCSRAHTCSGRCALQTAALLHDAAHKHVWSVCTALNQTLKIFAFSLSVLQMSLMDQEEGCRFDHWLPEQPSELKLPPVCLVSS